MLGPVVCRVLERIFSFLSECNAKRAVSMDRRVASVVLDLGVLMNNSFSPSVHCSGSACKAKKMCIKKRIRLPH